MKKDSFKQLIINQDLTQEMLDYIDRFKLNFKMIYGLIPYVSVNTRGSYKGKLNLEELLEIVNKKLEQEHPGLYPEGITQKSREKQIMVYRQAFCKIATSLGYKVTTVAEFININHATVIHSSRTVNDLLKFNDKYMSNCMDGLYSDIEDYICRKENQKVISKLNQYS